MFSRIKLNSLMNRAKVGLRVASTQIKKAKLDLSLNSQGLVDKIILVFLYHCVPKFINITANLCN